MERQKRNGSEVSKWVRDNESRKEYKKMEQKSFWTKLFKFSMIKKGLENDREIDENEVNNEIEFSDLKPAVWMTYFSLYKLQQPIFKWRNLGYLCIHIIKK